MTLQTLITQTLTADRSVWLVGFDPGRDKCGVAIVRLTPCTKPNAIATLQAMLTVEHRAVIPSAEAIAYLQSQCQTRYPAQVPDSSLAQTIAGVIMGDGTTSKQWLTQLQQLQSLRSVSSNPHPVITATVPPSTSTPSTSTADIRTPTSTTTILIERINEYNSTQEARDRYWQLYPPQGFTRLVPAALRTIEQPIDDIVAVILVERFVTQFLTISS